MTSTAISLMDFFMAVFSIAKSQDILSKSFGFEGEQLSLTCDLRRAGLTVFSRNLFGVRSLTVSKLNRDTNIYETKVIYSSPAAFDNNLLNNKIDSAFYHVLAQGLDENNPYDIGGNQNQMMITISYKSLRCVDRGRYQCRAEYVIESDAFLQIQNLSIDVSPTRSLDVRPFEPLGYESNQVVTFRCRFKGPPGMEIRWIYQECQSISGIPRTIQRWPYEKDIETTTTSQGGQDCGTMELESRLKDVRLDQMNNLLDLNALLCWVQCQAGVIGSTGFRILTQWNVTIDYKCTLRNAPVWTSTGCCNVHVVVLTNMGLTGIFILLVVSENHDSLALYPRTEGLLKY